MADIEQIASELLPGYVWGWFEEDIDVDPEQAHRVCTDLMAKFESAGWESTAQALKDRMMNPIVECIEVAYCREVETEEAEARIEAAQRKEQALQADASRVEQMELF